MQSDIKNGPPRYTHKVDTDCDVMQLFHVKHPKYIDRYIELLNIQYRLGECGDRKNTIYDIVFNINHISIAYNNCAANVWLV